ncbi:MAG: hypothetical protein C5B53_08655 [Candidatus Melainabacteria bacterium]|nr:MAG: hypothetical protein C5B53_08655 [Candidatus Melainabacteria bacterium]
MNCQHCAKILQADWHFCPKCGRAVFSQKNTVLPFLSGDREEMFDEIARQAVARSKFKSGSYGSNVRSVVLEVIVRQALAGAPWREICAGPMRVNNITAEEVQAEVDRRSGAS